MEETITPSDVVTREDLVRFVYQLLNSDRDEWENRATDDYLFAVARVASNMGGRYANLGEKLPDGATWRQFAEILHAATVYE